MEKTVKAMKLTFEDRLEAIDWMAENAKDEGEFEYWREQLHLNYIRTNELFIDLDDEGGSIIMLNEE